MNSLNDSGGFGLVVLKSTKRSSGDFHREVARYPFKNKLWVWPKMGKNWVSKIERTTHTLWSFNRY